MTNLRDFAFTEDSTILEYVDIELDETTFRVRTPTLAESARIESNVSDMVEDENGEKVVKFNSAELQVMCLVELVTDPESGDKLFTLLDRGAILGSRKGSRLARLAEKVAETFLGAGKPSAPTSEETENSSSSADSPKTSE